MRTEGLQTGLEEPPEEIPFQTGNPTPSNRSAGKKAICQAASARARLTDLPVQVPELGPAIVLPARTAAVQEEPASVIVLPAQTAAVQGRVIVPPGTAAVLEVEVQIGSVARICHAAPAPAAAVR
jgi:hypothetical protein